MVDIATAGRVGKLIDRLVTGVYQTVFDLHRDEIRAQLKPLDAPAPAQLLDLAEFFLDDAFTPRVLHLRFRYAPAELRHETHAEWFGRGLVLADGSPSDELRLVFDMVMRARTSVCEARWKTNLAVPLVGTSQALSHASGELCDTFKHVREPSAPAHMLHHRLTGLRYARMDAHAAAWAQAGLTAPQIMLLTTAIESNEPADDESGALIDRAWLTSAGEVTAAGRTARAEIERDTNVRCQPWIDAVTDTADWVEALGALDALADVPPSS